MTTKTPGDPISREISSFFKQAVEAFDDVKETVLKGSHATKATVDVQLLKRTREKSLARLGELILEEVARGSVMPASCDALAREIKDLDGQIATAQTEADKLWKSDAPKASGANKVPSTPPKATTSQATAAGDDDEG